MVVRIPLVTSVEGGVGADCGNGRYGFRDDFGGDWWGK